MGLLKNAQSRIVAVLAPLFLSFVMPWALQANRSFRGEAQFRFDPSAMFASTVAEVLVSIVFVVVFVVSLLYLANNRTLESCSCSQAPYRLLLLSDSP